MWNSKKSPENGDDDIVFENEDDDMDLPDEMDYSYEDSIAKMSRKSAIPDNDENRQPMFEMAGLPQSIQSPEDNGMRETFMPMSEGYMRASMNKRQEVIEFSAN